MLLRNEQGKALNLKETEHKFHVLFPGGKKTKEDTPKPGTPVLDAAARGWGRGRRFHEEPAPCVRKYVLAKTMSRRGSGTSDTGSQEHQGQAGGALVPQTRAKAGGSGRRGGRGKNQMWAQLSSFQKDASSLMLFCADLYSFNKRCRRACWPLDVSL